MTDRVALVTGAARGQGAAIVKRLHADGYRVAACDVRDDELKALVGPEFAVDSIAAVAVADRVDNANHIAVGQRVVLVPTHACTAAYLYDKALVLGQEGRWEFRDQLGSSR